MLRKLLIATAATGALAIATPAMAGGNWGGSTSGWNFPPKPSGSSGSSSGSSSSSGGTQVPEPGMLGLAAVGLAGLGAIRLRRRKAK